MIVRADVKWAAVEPEAPKIRRNRTVSAAYPDGLLNPAHAGIGKDYR